MAKVRHILLVCGEASGDLHAAQLVREILEIKPELRISSVGGTALKQTKASVFYDIKELAAIGFFDALKKLPKFFALKKLILEKIKTEKPDAIILVDFSGFNLRLAKAISKNIPTIYYISPQVWASREGRVKTIQKHVNKMIVFFKFEQEFYRKCGIHADFVGHPLLDIVKPTVAKKEFLASLDFSESKTTLALLPGSRRQEIENILPIMLETSVLISKEIPDVQFIIAKAGGLDWDIYNRQIEKFNLNLKVVEGKTYDCLNVANFALVASGTATLETAIMQKPFVIIYKMDLLNYLLYLPQVKVPYIGMVNIVAKRKAIPEFIQFQASPPKIAQAVLKILSKPLDMEWITYDLAKIAATLGEKGAGKRAAQAIVNYLDKL